MRYRLTLALTAFLAGSTVPALAQAPTAITARSPTRPSAVPGAPPPAGVKPGGIAGTGFGTAVGITAAQVPLAVGTGRFGAGTGGTGGGVGNATGGVNGSPRAGTGGILDSASWGINTGGINGSGQGFDAGTGGITDTTAFGRNTGGTNDGSIAAIGAGTGGIANLNSLGAETGGINEPNAPRFRTVR
jgi:hypothetical protein